MKRFTQCVCVILIMAMLLAIPVSAAENAIQRSSDYFAKYSVYIWKTSGTEFEIWFDVTGVQTMDELGAKSIKLQRSTDKTNWTTVKTYSMDDYPQMVKENSLCTVDCVTYDDYSSDYYYRAVIVLYAKLGSGTGEATVVTATK